jgi:hypothetical protein
MQNIMFNRKVVHEALKRSRAAEKELEFTQKSNEDNHDGEISLLIYDIFGGEILKTRSKNGWHFYNRIDGERIDFTKSETDSPARNTNFEDIPATPDETHNNFEQEEYANFFMRFVWAFEEAVGLENPRPDYVA